MGKQAAFSNKKEKHEVTSPLWGIEVEEAGMYMFSIELACPKNESGGTYYLQIDGQQIGELQKVPLTSGWSSFQPFAAGEYKLSKGKHKIAVKGKDIIGSLMNLKSIEIKKL